MSSVQILPAILEKRKKEIIKKAKRFEGVAKEVQIDVVDGVFAPKITWPYTANFIDSLFKNYYLELPFKMELHLMVSKIVDFLNEYEKLSAHSLLVHIESEDFEDFLKIKSSQALRFSKYGLSVKMETELDEIEKYLEHFDYVQFMCIDDIGKQGSRFNEAVIDKIAEFKKRHRQFTVSADGGISKENIKLLFDAGVERFAVGSAIFKSENPVRAYKELLDFVEQDATM